MTERSNDAIYRNQTNKIKPNAFHETFCKTEVDPGGLTRVTLKTAQNTALIIPNPWQEIRGSFANRRYNNFRGFFGYTIPQYAPNVRRTGQQTKHYPVNHSQNYGRGQKNHFHMGNGHSKSRSNSYISGIFHNNYDRKFSDEGQYNHRNTLSDTMYPEHAVFQCIMSNMVMFQCIHLKTW